MSAFPDPVRRDYDMPDGVMSGVHFGPLHTPLKVVFLHANGFHGLAYRRVLEGLGVHALALDLRGHGHTQMPCPIETLESFHLFADDVIEFFKRYVSAPVILGGHSLGASTAILTMPSLRPQLSGFLGFDPVTLPRRGAWLISTSLGRNLTKKNVAFVRKAGRRRSSFSSIDEAFERYQNRGVFKGVTDIMLKDYIEGGFELRSDGQYHLRCNPLWEQAIYVAHKHNIQKAAKSLPDNTHAIYAGQGATSISTPSTRRAIKKAQPNIRMDYRAELAHLFPLQNPDIAAEAFAEILQKV